MKLRRIRRMALILGVALLLSALPLSSPRQVAARSLTLEPAPVSDLILVPAPSFDNMIMPMATHINQVTATLSINNSGYASMNAITIVYNKARIYQEVTLQRKVLLWWTDVVTFEHVGSDYLVTINKYQIKQRGTYRASVRATCNGETLTATTGQVVY